jgi:hypothetical protein
MQSSQTPGGWSPILQALKLLHEVINVISLVLLLTVIGVGGIHPRMKSSDT